MRFPSREWFEAAAAALAQDASVTALIADLGPVVAGLVVSGLSPEFCVLARIAPGKKTELRFPEDEDELEELEPDYVFRAPVELCKSLLRAERADLLQMVLAGRIQLSGDLQRLVRLGGKHQGAGAGTLRALPTEFV